MPKTSRRIITLLTDFGTRDHFVGVMKGVILGIAPEAEIVDITHDVEPFQIEQARFLLKNSWRYFPKKTIHVVVVDPGVGSERRPVLIEAAGHYFVGPDNGVLGEAVSQEGARARHITAARYFLKQVSQTFHGRDVFAPVAAHLTAGVAPGKFGPIIQDAWRPGLEAPIRSGKRYWVGSVVHIDRFGNLITNLAADDFPNLAASKINLAVGMVKINTLVSNYASAPPGEPVCIVGSCGTLEIIINQQSAAKCLGVGIGAPAELEIR